MLLLLLLLQPPPPGYSDEQEDDSDSDSDDSSSEYDSRNNSESGSDGDESSSNDDESEAEAAAGKESLEHYQEARKEVNRILAKWLSGSGCQRSSWGRHLLNPGQYWAGTACLKLLRHKAIHGAGCQQE